MFFWHTPDHLLTLVNRSMDHVPLIRTNYTRSTFFYRLIFFMDQSFRPSLNSPVPALFFPIQLVSFFYDIYLLIYFHFNLFDLCARLSGTGHATMTKQNRNQPEHTHTHTPKCSNLFNVGNHFLIDHWTRVSVCVR